MKIHGLYPECLSGGCRGQRASGLGVWAVVFHSSRPHTLPWPRNNSNNPPVSPLYLSLLQARCSEWTWPSAPRWHAGALSLQVRAVMAGSTCTCATGVQPHPAPESNQTRGPVRLPQTSRPPPTLSILEQEVFLTPTCSWQHIYWGSPG